MLRIAAFLIIGIVAAESCYGILSANTLLTATVACLGTLLFTQKFYFIHTILIFTTTLLLGATLTTHSLDKAYTSLPEREVRYEAVVASHPVIKRKVVSADLIISNLKHPIKIKASIYRDGRAERLQEGDGIIACSRLEKPTNYPKSKFDYRRYLLYHGYVGTTFIYTDDWCSRSVSLRNLSAVERTKLRALRYRNRMLEQYGKMGFTDQDYAVMSAMTLGEKSRLGKELKDDYSMSGASHILALSGLHLGIIYALLSLLLPKRRWRITGQMGIILAIWMYVFMVGMSASVVRSAIMLSIYAFVSLLNRDRMSLNALAVAAVVILTVSPLDFFDVGFQMSFMSVLFILLFYKPMLYTMPERVRNMPVAGWLWQMICVSVTAQIGVAPLVAFYFGRFSCYFLLTNLIVVPAATVILYGAVLSLPLSLVPALHKLLAFGLLKVVSWMNISVGFIASLPGASIENIRLNTVQLLLIYTVITLISLLSVYVKKLMKPLP